MIAAIAADTFACVEKTSEGLWVIYRHVADMAIIITAKRFKKARDRRGYCYKNAIMWVSRVNLIKTVSFNLNSEHWLKIKYYQEKLFGVGDWLWRLTDVFEGATTSKIESEGRISSFGSEKVPISSWNHHGYSCSFLRAGPVFSSNFQIEQTLLTTNICHYQLIWWIILLINRLLIWSKKKMPDNC